MVWSKYSTLWVWVQVVLLAGCGGSRTHRRGFGAAASHGLPSNALRGVSPRRPGGRERGS